MLIKNAMSTSVLTLTPNETFSEIVEFLSKNKISGAPVVNKAGKVVGMVSEKDLFNSLFPSEKVFYKDPEYYMDFDRLEIEAVKVKKLKAKYFMTRNVITISPEDHVLKACSIFIVNKIRRLPVINDNGKLVGIVTTNDIYRRFLNVIVDSNK